MNNRLKLHELLLTMCPNVYYQSPNNLQMKYPAIRYSKNDINNRFANNGVYIQNEEYSITVITKKVDDPIVNGLSKLPLCDYDRSFISDNLYHYVFKINY